jgi:hypothetical protein
MPGTHGVPRLTNPSIRKLNLRIALCSGLTLPRYWVRAKPGETQYDTPAPHGSRALLANELDVVATNKVIFRCRNKVFRNRVANLAAQIQT